MKIIYRGGYNTKTNADKSMFYEYAQATKAFMDRGKKVVFVTFAKPDHHYDPRLIEAYGTLPEIINNSSEKNIEWSQLDLIYIPGGETENLKKALLDYEFSLDKLKKDVIVIGDSAGAYVLSKYYFDKKQLPNGKTEYFLVEGLNPKSNLFTVAHIDNPYHAPPQKLAEAQKIASEKSLELLLLKENEAKLVEDYGEIKDFSIDEVLK